MALIELDEQDPNNPSEKLSFYVDDIFKKKIQEKLIPQVSKKDEDAVIVVDGFERTGKSVFAMQFAKLLDPTFNQSRLCFKPEDFRNAILNAQKNQCIIFDEAYRGFSSRNTLSEINNLLVSLMMEMGQKNLYVIVVLPSFYLLDRYVALFRTRFLIHIYKRKGKKGYWRIYNRKKKAKLYNEPKYKKIYAYPPISEFRGRFYNKYVINELEYREIKAKAFKDYKRKTKQEKFMEQRNKLLYALHDDMGLNIKDIVKICDKYKIKLKGTIISEIINKIKTKQDEGLEEEE